MLSRTKIILVLILSYDWSRLNGVLAILTFVDHSLSLIISFLDSQASFALITTNTCSLKSQAPYSRATPWGWPYGLAQAPPQPHWTPPLCWGGLPGYCYKNVGHRFGSGWQSHLCKLARDHQPKALALAPPPTAAAISQLTCETTATHALCTWHPTWHHPQIATHHHLCSHLPHDTNAEAHVAFCVRCSARALEQYESNWCHGNSIQDQVPVRHHSFHADGFLQGWTPTLWRSLNWLTLNPCAGGLLPCLCGLSCERLLARGYQSGQLWHIRWSHIQTWLVTAPMLTKQFSDI